jgi:hypothetical protein
MGLKSFRVKERVSGLQKEFKGFRKSFRVSERVSGFQKEFQGYRKSFRVTERVSLFQEEFHYIGYNEMRNRLCGCRRNKANTFYYQKSKFIENISPKGLMLG